MQDSAGQDSEIMQHVHQGMLDDLNTPQALSALSAPLKTMNDLLSTKKVSSSFSGTPLCSFTMCCNEHGTYNCGCLTHGIKVDSDILISVAFVLLMLHVWRRVLSACAGGAGDMPWSLCRQGVQLRGPLYQLLCLHIL